MNLLTSELIDRILEKLPWLSLGVVGDLFLDQYLDLEPTLTEPSLETGLDAYQIVRVRNQPGAAGTILNNLAALGVGRIQILSVIGQDANGFALKQELAKRKIETHYLIEASDRHTPIYCKPMLGGRELNRLDLKNRTPTPAAIVDQVIAALPKLWSEVQGLLILDQVSEENCGVVTSRVRDALAQLGAGEPRKLLLADSRERIGLFKNCWLKPNEAEAAERGEGGEERGERNGAKASLPSPPPPLSSSLASWAQSQRRPIFCTRGAGGILLAEDFGWTDQKGFPLTELHEAPAFPVAGPIDVVGAGDSVSAGIACAVAAGASLPEAAAFGNLIASITIQQLGTTGTATPAQVGARWAEAAGN